MTIVSTVSIAQAGDPPLKIFILAGQSNMAGEAPSNGLPPELLRPQKDVLLFHESGSPWLPLEPDKTFGPEITFGQAMAQHFGQPIGIVKVALGGTNLAVQWSPDDPHYLYASLVHAVKDAQKSRPTIIMGMLWMQGERDSRDETMANAYQKNLGHFIESVRRDFGDASLPFVCGRVNPVYPYVDIVRKAQESINLPNYRMVNCDDLAKNPDNLHYSPKGQQELGKRFAAAMIELLNPAKAQKKAP